MGTQSASIFSQWLARRAGLLGLGAFSDLCDASGISPLTLRRVAESGLLDEIDRSARAWLARALKVPLRELESFAAGAGPSIPDSRVVDLDRPPAASRPELAVADLARPSPVPAPPGRGVPIVARLSPGGDIQWLDAAAPRDTPRIPVRCPGVPDAFALAVEQDSPPDLVPETFLIFRNLPASQLAPGDIALITFSDGAPAGQSVLGRLAATSDGAAAIAAFAADAVKPVLLHLETIVRAARLIATHA